MHTYMHAYIHTYTHYHRDGALTVLKPYTYIMHTHILPHKGCLLYAYIHHIYMLRTYKQERAEYMYAHIIQTCIHIYHRGDIHVCLQHVHGVCIPHIYVCLAHVHTYRHPCMHTYHRGDARVCTQHVHGVISNWSKSYVKGWIDLNKIRNSGINRQIR